MSDLLVIDDENTWREIVVETFDGICSCDIADTYEAAISKIHEREYKAVCLNWRFYSINNGRKLLTLLKGKYPNVPVILMSGGFVGGVVLNVQSKYPNVKEILVKDSESDVVADLLEIVPPLIRSVAARGPVHVVGGEPGLFSWLHLSDLHSGCKKGNWDWKSLKNALLDDLREHQNSAPEQSKHLAGVVFQPDVILITGDIAYRGAEEEYEEAEGLLKSIWGVTGLGKEQTFVVPGNHDVDRKAIEGNPLHEAVCKELADPEVDEETWFRTLYKWWNFQGFQELIEKKFEHYMQFSSKCTAVSVGRSYYTQTIRVSRKKIDIIGLNSALISWKDKEDRERSLWIGKPQLDEIENSLADDAVLRITLFHHPREALHEHDVAWIWTRLQEKCSILLHGHLHKQEAVLTHDPDRESICLAGGSVQKKEGLWQSQRYSYGQIDLNTGKLDLYLRMTRPGAYPLYIRDSLTYPKAGADGHVEIILRKDRFS